MNSRIWKWNGIFFTYQRIYDGFIYEIVSLLWLKNIDMKSEFLFMMLE